MDGNSEQLQVINLKQLPIIEERLRDVKAKIEQRTSAVMALAVTEETRTDVKKIRTEVRKELEGYPAILARKMLTATPAIAVRIFPRRRVRLSWLLTAVRSSFPAGTIAMATKFCWITARACLRGMPT